MTSRRADVETNRSRDEQMSNSRVATDEQIARLNASMTDLEAMLQELGNASSVLDFEVEHGASRGMCTTANQGAALLAAEVGEELKKWRTQREDDLLQRSRAYAQKLKQMVADRRLAARDRAKIRQIVRVQLFQDAEDVLSQRIDESAKRPPEHLPPEASEEDAVVGLGPSAIFALRRHLDDIIAPLEALRPDRPAEMQNASTLMAIALERKKKRVQTQPASLPAMATMLDAELLDEAEQSIAARKEGIVDQYERQLASIHCIQQAMKSRCDAFEELASLQNRGPPTIKKEVWRVLWPKVGGATASKSAIAGDGNEVEGGGKIVPHQRRPEQADAASVEVLQQRLKEKGEARIEELCDDFRQKHLNQGQVSQHQQEAQTDLELWKLRAKDELLADLRAKVQAASKGQVARLRESLHSSSAAPLEQLSSAVAAGEDFNRDKNEIFGKVMSSAEAKLTGLCDFDREMFAGWRRRAELCSLKRWHDVSHCLQAYFRRAQAKNAMQLGDAAQRLINDCHVALPLPSEDFRALGRPTQAPTGAIGKLVSSWERYNAPTSERMSFAQEVVRTLGDTVECIAVMKASLSLIDDEVQRVVRKLKERLNGNTAVSVTTRKSRGPTMQSARGNKAT
eukprot:TRINITY_DN62901_c0_g1_i1.p1 TRINITY_DN62901_c0_g1~~TRINITY_DN62901_c0_g1_i1.p1  ORF type:complete len:626 (+),score=123.21 TRINITY_DN62901_c0_g1_i1:145-2022(+)